MKINPAFCKASVSTGRGFAYQCSRKPGFGKDKAYCQQHGRIHPEEGFTPLLGTLYKVGGYDDDIVPVKAHNITEKTFLDANGSRNALTTEWATHYADWETARQALVARAKKELARHERGYAKAQEDLKRFLALTPPAKKRTLKSISKGKKP